MERSISQFKVTSDEGYYVVICDDMKYGNPIFDPLICGVFASYKEAKEMAKGIKDCMCSHTIKKVRVTVEWGYDKQRRIKKPKKGATPAKPGKDGSARA